MSFFDELKRRNVFRVGIAYGVTSWLLIQVADILFESIGAPAWVLQAMFVLLGVGFVIALLFAWAFELTPEGVKREREVDRSQSITPQTGRKLDRTIIAILVLALGYFVVDKFYLSVPTVSTPETAAAPASETTVEEEQAPQTIAVLPFVDMSAEGDNEYFSDGLTEELLNILAKIRELRVAGRTSSFAFKGKDEDLRSIGEKLSVETILEGSVRKDDKRNRVRITAQLVNVEDGYHLWSETYDRDLEDIFAIQEEIAREVAQAMRITLLGEDEERIAHQAVTDLSAYDLYLQGLKSFNGYTFASLKRAVEDFDQAIQQDPDYIPAQLKQAETWLELSQTGASSRNEATSNAIPILENILNQDSANSEAHALMARALRFERKSKAAEQEFQLALDTNPRNVYALTEYGRLLIDSGTATRGMEYLQEAGRIDPYSVRVLWNLQMAHSFLLEPDKAGDYTRRIGEILPDNPMQYYGPGIAHGMAGNLAQALVSDLKAIELDPNDYELKAGVAMDWAMLGDLEMAESWAKKADETGSDQPIPILARVLIYQSREQYGLAADLSKRALDRGLDNRQASNSVFRHTWVTSLVRSGKISEALAFYKETFPGAFQDPPDLDMDSQRRSAQLVEIAMLLHMQDPGSPHAVILLDAAEQKLELIEAAWIPWLMALRQAALATARNNKPAAIEHLLGTPGNRFGRRWRELLTNWFVLDPLRDEPEFKQLIAMLEKDMENQREEAYELLGIAK